MANDVLRLRQGWTKQPQYPVQIAAGYGSPSVWLPSAGSLDLSGRSPLTLAATGKYGLGIHGKTFQHTGADFTDAFSVSPLSGATHECWLFYIDRNTSGGGARTMVHDSGSNDYFRGGTGVVYGSIASSSVRCSTTINGADGDRVFFVHKDADYRIYLRTAGGRTEKVTGGVAFGGAQMIGGLYYSDQSWALLARWTNEIPPDATIWKLLENPWALFAP